MWKIFYFEIGQKIGKGDGEGRVKEKMCVSAVEKDEYHIVLESTEETFHGPSLEVPLICSSHSSVTLLYFSSAFSWF